MKRLFLLACIPFLAFTGLACNEDPPSERVPDDVGSVVDATDDAGGDTGSDAASDAAPDTAPDTSPEPTCQDGLKNGNETDVDCGGVSTGCDACPRGSACTDGEDCQSGVCGDEDTCVAPTCEDGVKNGDETGTDCGGPECGACAAQEPCEEAADCQSGVCSGGGARSGTFCQAPSCSDGVKNGEESSVDCGGSECMACEAGDACQIKEDCATGVCRGGACARPTCTDGVKNGQETDVDCGGGGLETGCEPCAKQQACSANGDCRSNVCDMGTCVAATCTDGVRNHSETDVDCGGANCNGCAVGGSCGVGADCVSGVCDNGTCQEPTCSDGVQNGAETDVDCGASSNGCGPCKIGGKCKESGDCTSGVCSSNRCQAPACGDGVQNGTETDVDCGGNCKACSAGDGCKQDGDCATSVCKGGSCAAPTCSDGAANGQETDVDCGGPSCGPCTAGGTCQKERDCATGVCTGGSCQQATCSDGVRNGGESDVDCGGPCGACQNGKSCSTGGDCQSNSCKKGTCSAATCADRVLNGRETDVDCGGPNCPGCGAGGSCSADGDCASAVCENGSCQQATCKDGVENGRETGVDCGGLAAGSGCTACANGKGCNVGGDCLSGVCTANTCAQPTCSDKVLNGDETDVDCGGKDCGSCSVGATCSSDSDCSSGVCTSSTCRAPTCSDNTKNGQETDVDCGGAGSGCPACAANKSCSVDGDCKSGVCTNNSCQAVFASCQDLKNKKPNAADGVYKVDFDGAGSTYQPMDVYCEMDFHGGGWMAVFNRMEMGESNSDAATFYNIITTNKAMNSPVKPDSDSSAIYTSNLPLDQFTTVVYGWAPSSNKDVARWGEYTESGGLAGECYLDGYCGNYSVIATMQAYPQKVSRTIRTGNNPSYPHVGMGYSGQQITWGFDNNRTSYSHWANWDITSCCNSANTPEMANAGWRYVIYVR